MEERNSVVVAKFLSVWAAFGFASWQEAAAAAATVYSLLLICDWFWKRFWRPALERAGVLAPRPRHKDTDWDRL